MSVVVGICNSCSWRISPFEKCCRCVAATCSAPLCDQCFRNSSMCELCKWKVNGMAPANAKRKQDESGDFRCESIKKRVVCDQLYARRTTKRMRNSAITDYFAFVDGWKKK